MLRAINLEDEHEFVRRGKKLSGDFTLLPVRVNGADKKISNAKNNSNPFKAKE